MKEITDYQHWQETVQHVHLPRWKELPTLGLYVDQVVMVVNEHLASFDVEPLTKAMVNNYVKKKVIQAPIKKKYAVNQLVDLLLIGFFKVSFNIDDIRAGIAQLTIDTYPQLAYDHFAAVLESILTGQPIDDGIEIKPANQELMESAIKAVLAHLKAEHIFADMRRRQQPLKVEKG